MVEEIKNTVVYNPK